MQPPKMNMIALERLIHTQRELFQNRKIRWIMESLRQKVIKWLDRRHQGLRTDAARWARRHDPASQPAIGGPVELEVLWERMDDVDAQRVETNQGQCWALQREVPQIGQQADDDAGANPYAGPDPLPMLNGTPDGWTFFDTETMGLGSVPVFLIGFLEIREEGPLITQLFAQDYSEEAAILDLFAKRLNRTETLVSFNGKSFDWPLVESRAGCWQVPLPPGDSQHHLDLLYESRRQWGNSLPNCKLQTIESNVCGRRRRGDIPGREIPGVYRAFVNTGNARPLAPVFTHNALDLVTLVEIVSALHREREDAR